MDRLFSKELDSQKQSFFAPTFCREQQIKYNMFVKPNQDLGETHLFASNKYKVCDTFSLAPINKFFLLT